MDLSLPVIDGLNATREIRRTGGLGSVPVVALTAHAEEEYRELALSAGCTGFLSKPVDFAALEGLLRSLDTFGFIRTTIPGKLLIIFARSIGPLSST